MPNVYSWFVFHCQHCGARLIVDNDRPLIHCDVSCKMTDGHRDATGLTIYTANTGMSGLLDGCEETGTRPRAAVTIIAPGGVAVLSRAEYQEFVTIALHEILIRGPLWEAVDGAVAKVRKAVLGAVELNAIRTKVAELGRLLGQEEDGAQ